MKGPRKRSRHQAGAVSDSDSRPQDQRGHRSEYLLLSLFIILTAGIIFVGITTFRGYSRNFRIEIERRLSSISDLKVAEITEWRKELYRDADSLSNNLAFADLVRRAFSKSGDPSAFRFLRAWLATYQTTYDNARVFLLDTEADLKISVPESNEPLAPHLAKDVPAAVAARKATLLDFHREQPHSPIHLSMLIPILDKTDRDRPLGVVVIKIDPGLFLYPLIQRWPTPSRTAETLLVRREGDSVQFLNELKFQPNSALNLKYPLASARLLSARAARGEQGILEGVDYRGVPVIGYARSVPDSPWFIVTRMDSAEAFGPLRARLWLMTGFLTAILLGAGAGFGLIWRQQRANYFRARMEATQRLQVISSRQEALLSAIPDIIMEVDANKIYVWANKPGLNFFGDDAIGKEAAYYFEGEQETYHDVQPLFNGLENVVYVESWQRRKDGEKRLLAWSCRVLKDNAGAVIGALSSARDITEQTLVATALRESEKKFRETVEFLDDGYYSATLEGLLLDHNPAFNRILGLDPDLDLRGRSTPDFWENPEDRKPYLDELITKGSIVNYMVKAKKVDGSRIHLMTNSHLVKDEKAGPVRIDGSFIDFTDRKRKDEEIARAAREWQTTFDATNDAVWILDRDFRVRQTNKTAERIFKWSREDMLGRHCWEIMHGTTQPLPECPVIRLRESLHRETMELRIGENWFEIVADPILDASGELSGVVHIVSEITERKAAEQALRSAEERVRSIIEEAPFGAHSYELDPDGRLIFSGFNRSADRILGIRHAALIGKTIEDAFPPLGGTPIPALYRKVAATGERYDEEQVDYNDGQINGAFDVHAFQTGPDRMTVFFRNITERKRAEDSLKASLREKEVLLREIHHRVKNNMQVISSLFNLQARAPVSAECREILREGQTRIRSMSLVHEKLYQSRDLSKIDLAGYIQSLAVHLLNVYLVDHEQVRLETEFEDVALDINSAIPCGLILNELISNALKHAFPNGRTGVIRIGLKRGAGGAVELRVADDGVGFPAETDFREAESFGLQIVNLLVHQLEAAIDLDRTNGAAFTVTFRELKYAPRI